MTLKKSVLALSDFSTLTEARRRSSAWAAFSSRKRALCSATLLKPVSVVSSTISSRENPAQTEK
jgi:hypothetical protein